MDSSYLRDIQKEGSIELGRMEKVEMHSYPAPAEIDLFKKGKGPASCLDLREWAVNQFIGREHHELPLAIRHGGKMLQQHRDIPTDARMGMHPAIYSYSDVIFGKWGLHKKQLKYLYSGRWLERLKSQLVP